MRAEPQFDKGLARTKISVSASVPDRTILAPYPTKQLVTNGTLGLLDDVALVVPRPQGAQSDHHLGAVGPVRHLELLGVDVTLSELSHGVRDLLGVEAVDDVLAGVGRVQVVEAVEHGGQGGLVGEDLLHSHLVGVGGKVRWKHNGVVTSCPFLGWKAFAILPVIF